MAVKIGDTVRYLNAVGGGIVVRIQGDIAYVDEDGFETPVLMRECVVIAAPAADVKSKAAPKVTVQTPPVKESAPQPTRLPVVETSTGEKMNLVLGFEATDIKALSQSGFEAYFVNDSNYYVFVSVAAKATDDEQWHPWYDGIIEPNIQEFLFEFSSADLASFDRVAVQYAAFKRGKDFCAKEPGRIEIKVDTTKFAKFHCFRRNEYFDNPVIAFDIVSNDRQVQPLTLTPESIAAGMKQKAADVKASAPRQVVQKPKELIFGPFEIDLHASALFDTLSGLDASDILNAQIDRFEAAMREHQKRPGTRLIFIHGKGDGVLKQAILKELAHRFKGHDVQDAPFEKYGYGATQVTIRYVASQNDRQRGKRR